MHGDEPGGRVLLPMLAEWLCANAATDPRAKRIIQGMHLVRCGGVRVPDVMPWVGCYAQASGRLTACYCFCFWCCCWWCWCCSS